MSQVCVPLVLLILCSTIQVTSTNSLELLKEKWGIYRNQCLDHMGTTPPATELVCNRTFDQYACWPDGLPGNAVNISCPWFLPWYSHGHVNTTECEDDPNHQQYGHILGQLRAMYTIGHSLSLGALTLALGILITFRKLHCIRNNIHMNLFSSFILRAASILLKDALLDTLVLASDPRSSTHRQPEEWASVPGLYLHSLLVTTVFSERNYFYIYLAIGWGAPLVFVLPWVTVKYWYENEECWERNINMGYWWIIRCPILFAYLINFFIFIRIVKILMSKLKAHQMRYTDYKFRLAKSTLTLIPLLGIHAILFTFIIDESVPKGSMLRIIRLFCDLLFNSFQGLLVAILYCFVNKEVQSEMLKKWKRWKLGKDIDEGYRHTHSHTPHPKSNDPLQQQDNNDPLQQQDNTQASVPAPPPSGGDGGPRVACYCQPATPQEKCRLVVAYSEGRGRARQTARHSLHFRSMLQGLRCEARTTTTSSSITSELLCLEERGQDHHPL
ncbi:hypothetical protein NHX12_018073 [Muraenolepis orangiensis]|uniref:Glucagon receptor n=1 Tax=Muraenolepis orangiensis TaxID=630683 RepID=A0A9Q0IYL0_9TELE|nr:hypothetical protein NHX12_018073 [Muraenolepis orangiensis]